MNKNIQRVIWVMITILLIVIHPVAAQNEVNDGGPSIDVQPVPNPKLEIFAGAELLYRDIYFNKLFEAVVNITPGVKWNIGNDWQLAGQVIVPVYNDYGGRYKKVRLNMAVLSKEIYFGGNQFLKVSGGLFGMERYGLDVKWMFPVNRWLAFDAQLGLTGFCSMAVDWEASEMTRVTGWAGARVYIPKVNTEFRLRGGRYLYEDYGVKFEAMRHFKHCTVGAWAQYNDIDHENAGFKIVMMIPPYKRRARKVQFRPASNFRLTHNFKSQAYSMKMYTTDPEENEREGDFNRTKLNWGANTMVPDFQLKEGGKR